MYVADALLDHKWISAIRGSPSVPTLVDFLILWDLVRVVEVSEVQPDRVTWRLTPNGSYSAKSAYRAFFFGRVAAPGAKELWSSRAPLVFKLHMWFVLRDRLWTADRLSRRGMQHPPVCPLCCQEPETVNHLTLQCPFSR